MYTLPVTITLYTLLIRTRARSWDTAITSFLNLENADNPIFASKDFPEMSRFHIRNTYLRTSGKISAPSDLGSSVITELIHNAGLHSFCGRLIHCVPAGSYEVSFADFVGIHPVSDSDGPQKFRNVVTWISSHTAI